MAFLSVKTATGALPTNNTCAPEQLEVFSCVLKSHQVVGICLHKSTLKMEFALGVRDQGGSVLELSDVREATTDEHIHGNTIVLSAHAVDRVIQLFVDGNYADAEVPQLVIKTNAHDQREECVDGTVVHNPAVVTVDGHEKAANLFSLEMDGIAAKLDNPPPWPVRHGP
jgi:hypothetical protein